MKFPIPNTLELPTVYGYPNPDRPNAYFYLPRQLQPQRDSADEPMLNLVSVGSGAYLQLSVHWDANAPTLDALRQQIVQQPALAQTSADPADVLLTFAPATVQQVSLQLGDGRGHWQELQQAKSSGFVPYATLFNRQLDAEQQAQVAAALNGRRDFCRVCYTISLPSAVDAMGQVLGDATGVIAQLKSSLQSAPSSDPRTLVHTSLQAALNRGELQLTVSAIEGAPLSLEETVKTKVFSQAADLLLRFLQNETLIPDTTTLRVRASRTLSVATALMLTTDIATWFGASPGSDRLVLAPTTHTDPAPIDPLSKLPEEHSLAAPAVSSTAGDGALGPEAPGLVNVTVKACALAEAGAQKARVVLRYHPTGQDISDETTLYFRHDHWQATWRLIRPSDVLAGSLDYEWQVTTASGELIKHKRQTASSPHISLSLPDD